MSVGYPNHPTLPRDLQRFYRKGQFEAAANYFNQGSGSNYRLVTTHFDRNGYWETLYRSKGLNWSSTRDILLLVNAPVSNFSKLKFDFWGTWVGTRLTTLTVKVGSNTLLSTTPNTTRQSYEVDITGTGTQTIAIGAVFSLSDNSATSYTDNIRLY